MSNACSQGPLIWIPLERNAFWIVSSKSSSKMPSCHSGPHVAVLPSPGSTIPHYPAHLFIPLIYLPSSSRIPSYAAGHFFGFILDLCLFFIITIRSWASRYVNIPPFTLLYILLPDSWHLHPMTSTIHACHLCSSFYELSCRHAIYAIMLMLLMLL